MDRAIGSPLRRLVSNGLAVGAFVCVGFLGVAICLWSILPSALRLTASDRAIVGPPLFLMVVATAITHPLRVYRALLAGLQDVVFNGVLGVSEAAITAGVTIVMLFKGRAASMHLPAQLRRPRCAAAWPPSRERCT